MHFNFGLLAKRHNLAVRLALWIEVGAALAAAHWKRGQRVLEDLLKAKELQDIFQLLPLKE